ncbi:hypothetical protein Scep_023186 [Stephania cephalantha]|uniref:Rab-GAP TBC domain-containing protein n=1 Tax=Stephania cephalantha TaxID=152367 RepID=A0AAP0EU82_9MAGN
MICGVPIEVPMSESSPSVSVGGGDPRFCNLRGVQWRISLGILPGFSSIEELRRVTADARRRYASLRRRLLVDPHLTRDGSGSSSPDLVMDNPLSQNPDSSWGRFFRNAELEKMVDQDLSRLYPEDGSYFQTPACQGMLRRILLLWCLRHPECGYRQGMHELLAPLLYVLHVDVERLAEVRKLYEDHFVDKFDDISFPESDLVCNYKSLKRLSDIEDEKDLQGSSANFRSLDELDTEIQTVVLLSDAYGAEGELGILLSERFMEHDAYCMFDALMGGGGGVVAMANYFSPSPAIGSYTGVPPVIEASSALYHLLSIVDSSLHSHLVELGVEPQYFALRWLRVLFGREFLLADLLIIWDEIFLANNSKSNSGAEYEEYGFEVLCCSRGAFISAMAVSMLLHLRSSLLATEHATSCLQRLLNFPEHADVKKLIGKAKSLQGLALQDVFSTPPSLIGSFVRTNAPTFVRGQSLPHGSKSPTTPLNLVPESYWEEKWRDAQNAAEAQKDNKEKQNSSRKKGLAEKLKFSLARTESDPSPAKDQIGKKEPRVSVRRRLLEDLSRALGSDEDVEKLACSEVQPHKDSITVSEERTNSESQNIEENGLEKGLSCVANSAFMDGLAGSEENSSIFSASSSPRSAANDHENEFEKSSVASNLSADENADAEPNNKASSSSADENDNTECNSDEEEEQLFETKPDESPLPVSDLVGCDSLKPTQNVDSDGKPPSGLKERKLLQGKFPWFWKLGRGASEGTSSDKGGVAGAPKSQSVGVNHNNGAALSTTDGCCTSKGDTADNNNVMVTLKNLGQSMLENIQAMEGLEFTDHYAIEWFISDRVGVSAGPRSGRFARELVSKHSRGKGQVTAVAALKELRKISNLISEM